MARVAKTYTYANLSAEVGIDLNWVLKKAKKSYVMINHITELLPSNVQSKAKLHLTFQ